MNEKSCSFHNEKELRNGQVSKHFYLGKKVLVWDMSLIIRACVKRTWSVGALVDIYIFLAFCYYTQCYYE